MRMKFIKIKSIKSCGKRKTYDLKVMKNNNFYLGNDILSHNSGKSAGTDIIAEVAKRLDIKVESQNGETTEAKAIGTKKEIIVKGEKIYKEEKGWFRNIEEGGIVIWDEAKMFLSSSEKSYNTGLPGYVQIAMNPIGTASNTLTKGIVGMDIKMQPKFSFFFLTHPIKDKMLDTLQGGLFQRCSVFCRELTRNEWNKMGSELDQSICESHTKKNIDSISNILKENENAMVELVNMFKEIQKFINKIISENKHIIISPEASAEGKKFMYELDKKISGINTFNVDEPTEVERMFNSFRNRSIMDVWVFAFHHALADKRIVVRKNDVLYAKILLLGTENNKIKGSLQSLMEAVESLTEVAKTDTQEVIRWKEFKKDFATLTRGKIKEGLISSNDIDKIILTRFSEIKSVGSAKVLRSLWVKRGFLTKIHIGKNSIYYRIG